MISIYQLASGLNVHTLNTFPVIFLKLVRERKWFFSCVDERVGVGWITGPKLFARFSVRCWYFFSIWEWEREAEEFMVLVENLQSTDNSQVWVNPTFFHSAKTQRVNNGELRYYQHLLGAYKTLQLVIVWGITRSYHTPCKILWWTFIIDPKIT